MELRVSSGALSTFDPPSGAGIGIEPAGHRGYAANPSFDSLLAKVVIRSASSEFEDATRRAYRSLCEFDISGAQTNLALLQNILLHPEFVAGHIDTRFVEAHAKELVAVSSDMHPGFRRSVGSQPTEAALVDDNSYVADGVLVRSPMQGRLLSIDVNVGDRIRSGHALLVVEAMKMEHSVVAEVAGVVTEVLCSAGDSLRAGAPLVVIAPYDLALDDDANRTDATTSATERLDVLLEQRAALLDEARPGAVAKQRERGALTARKRIALLCADSFVEFGSSIAARRSSSHRISQCSVAVLAI
ncbi:biotin/lipoyl-containing protein [Bradyrhizobium sp. B097]|uniref:biotin/lipoyl-containing protein n=1 Tax=Bradyrhizobium sp. B097 TaxID=3140244 RepID=UPI00318430C6